MIYKPTIYSSSKITHLTISTKTKHSWPWSNRSEEHGKSQDWAVSESWWKYCVEVNKIPQKYWTMLWRVTARTIANNLFLLRNKVVLRLILTYSNKIIPTSVVNIITLAVDLDQHLSPVQEPESTVLVNFSTRFAKFESLQSRGTGCLHVGHHLWRDEHHAFEAES